MSNCFSDIAQARATSAAGRGRDYVELRGEENYGGVVRNATLAFGYLTRTQNSGHRYRVSMAFNGKSDVIMTFGTS